MKRQTLLPAILLAFVFCVSLVAQEKKDDTSATQDQVVDSPPPLDEKVVKNKLAGVESNTTLDETQKEALRSKLNTVLELLDEANKFEKNASDFAKSLEESPKKAEQNRQLRAGLPTLEEAGQVGSADSFESLRDEVDKASLTLETKASELKAVSTKLLEMETRPVEIVARLPDARKVVKESRSAWEASEKTEKTLTEAEQAELWTNQVKWIRAANEIKMLQQEQLSYRQREDELTSHVALLKREVENSNAKVASLNRLLSEEISVAIEKFRSVAQIAMESMPSDLAVQDLGQGVISLTTDLSAVSTNSKTLGAKKLRLKTRMTELENDYLRIKEELRLGSGGIEMAQVLIELGRRVGERPVESVDLMSVEKARLIWFDARKKIRNQKELEKRFQNYPPSVKDLVAAHSEVLDRLKVESNDLTAGLSNLNLEMQNYLKLCAEIQDFVAQKLFGFEVKTSPVIGLESLTNTPAGIAWLFSSIHAKTISDELVANGFVVTFVMVMFFVLIFSRRYLDRRIQKLHSRTLRISTDHIKLTIWGLLLTALLAAPLPLLWFLLGWVLSHSSTEYQWMVGLIFVSQQLLFFVAITLMFWEVARPDGIGVKHFKWSDSSASALRSKLFWTFSVYLPLILVASCFVYGGGAGYFSSTGRVAFILAHLGILVAFNPLRNRNQSQVEVGNSEASNGQARWFKILAITITFSSLSLVLLGCIGFLMTATYLSVYLATTMAIMMLFRLAYCFTNRWLEIRRRKLAFAAAIALRKARLDAADEEESENDSQEDLKIDEEDELKLDLETAGKQSERILRLAFNVAMAITIYIYWSTVIPLSSILDKTSIPLVPGVSIFQLAQACIVVFVAIVLIKNLPGLIEFVVLSRSKIEVGTRKAIYALGQYAVCALVVVVLSNILEWDWSRLGWLAAALSVGLGFGLQEIVANFVCGIILLFERPIRIGDVVSLAGNTGVVTKINLRATVITDWDRQEIVVPNKNLITGTIFNWTLSAKLNRVVVPLGVAFGTDTAKATQIMLEVAAAHPDVLEDPGPSAHFTQFGDCSLDLVLRAFLADRDKRENVMTELNSEIARRFEMEGIEIPYPQRDLNLKSGWNPSE